MIYAIIDGKKAWPDGSANIKLTLENPHVRVSDSYTYEISFPMSVMENLQVFGNIHRLDVSKRKKVYDECQLYVDNLLVVAGIGTVTNITHEAVKLQIIGGASRVRFKTSAESLFLDEIDMGEVDAAHAGWVSSIFAVLTPDQISEFKAGAPGGNGYTFFGVGNEYETILQNCIHARDENISEAVMFKYPTPQVQLMHVLKCVMEVLGYTIAINDYDSAPWTQLYICNSRQSPKLQHCVPHWKVSTFLEEFRKLFNATFLYHEMEHTVDILSKGNGEEETVTYECSDEFSAEYDEDGLQFMGTDTIGYSYRESAFREYPEYISEEIFDKFPLQEYDTYDECRAAVNRMAKKEAMTTLFYVREYDLHYYAWESSSGGYILSRVGWFHDLRRSSNRTELKIVPAAFGNFFADYEERGYKEAWYLGCPFVEGSALPRLGDEVETEAVEDEYQTIRDVVEEGVAVENGEDEDDVMELAFTQGVPVTVKAERKALLDFQPWRMTWRAFTDSWMDADAKVPASLALSGVSDNRPYVGQFHKDSLQVNINSPVNIRFLCDGLPDPTKFFIFKGKKYLCAKVEISINGDGIDKIKSGYFYEILSQ